jgi:hypothetical protein
VLLCDLFALLNGAGLNACATVPELVRSKKKRSPKPDGAF